MEKRDTDVIMVGAGTFSLCGGVMKPAMIIYGATGAIGSAIAKLLYSRGYFQCMTRSGVPLWHPLKTCLTGKFVTTHCIFRHMSVA